MTAAVPVTPDRILRELADLWTSLGKHEEQGSLADQNTPEEGGLLRACTMTLIVFVDAEDDPAIIGEMLANLMRSHPSRAVVVRVAPASATLGARVFAQCWMPIGRHLQICCEQIELTAPVDRLDDLPSIIAPIAASDVPRVLWFRSTRLGEAGDLSGILALANKVVVDSARVGAPAYADLRTLASAGYIVGDLAWTRLTRIREWVAHLLAGRDLGQIRNVELTYAGQVPGPAAKYFQTWLRTELPGAAVNLRWVESAEPGELRAVKVDEDLDIHLEKGRADCVAKSFRQHAALAPDADDELINEELRIMQHDPIFERVLDRMTPWAPKEARA